MQNQANREKTQPGNKALLIKQLSGQRKAGNRSGGTSRKQHKAESGLQPRGGSERTQPQTQWRPRQGARGGEDQASGGAQSSEGSRGAHSEKRTAEPTGRWKSCLLKSGAAQTQNIRRKKRSDDIGGFTCETQCKQV